MRQGVLSGEKLRRIFSHSTATYLIQEMRRLSSRLRLAHSTRLTGEVAMPTILRLLRRIWCARANLTDLDDRTLADIGLTRMGLPSLNEG